LKSAINIPFKSSSKSPVDLLIEIGDFGFTLLWTSNQLATIDGFAVYVFEENDNQKERIESILNSSQIKGVDFNSVNIRYNYSASLLVPEKHFQSSLNEEMLSLVYGKNEEGEINNDVVALKNEENYLIQVKQTKSTVGNEAIQEICTAKKYYESKFNEEFKLLTITNNEYTSTAEVLAKSNEIKLINRLQLEQMIISNDITIQEINKLESQRMSRI